MEIIDWVIRIMSAEDSLLSDDQLLAALLLFTSRSEDAVHAAHTFMSACKNFNPSVQYRFLHHQLEIAALLLEKGKGKAV